MSSEAAQYGRHGFELNGLFVDDGIIRSYHPLPPGAWVVLDGEDDFPVDVAPLIGVALCEFPDEDGGACHQAFCLAALAEWGVALYDGAAPGGDGFLGISHTWPHDRAKWHALAEKRKGSRTHGEAKGSDAGGWDDSEGRILGGIPFRGTVRTHGQRPDRDRPDDRQGDRGADGAGARVECD